MNCTLLCCTIEPPVRSAWAGGCVKSPACFMKAARSDSVLHSVLLCARIARAAEWASECVISRLCFVCAASSVCGLRPVLQRNTWADGYVISRDCSVKAASPVCGLRFVLSRNTWADYCVISLACLVKVPALDVHCALLECATHGLVDVRYHEVAS